ncbi:alpha/beta hydrolase [Alphaproteobacteria bacterium]|jgi:haloacetate dehalogenase|nr:alpha/beta hydrolase [Alphaproteobacteria bacterium]|tara:strand:- start:239 stop:1108 length:870 start_codon:yes stop_codon:yes gene_type:complete
MFKNFKQDIIEVNGVNINYKIGGKGEPLLLLHGYPQSHVLWRKIAPLFAENYTVICSDLRGYGDSDKPQSDKKHLTYSKKTMGLDQNELMKKLGFKEYFLVGHDRGGRVAHRMAIDFKENIKKISVLDIVPTSHVFKNTNAILAKRYYHWFFLIQSYPLPETMIGNDPEYYIRSKLQMWGANNEYLTEEIIQEYLRCFTTETIQASCEDYRAGASIDLVHHEEDFDKKISCPLQVLWGSKATIEELYDPIKVWKEWALNVEGQSIDCGHFLPEESPVETYNAIINFFKK